MTTEESGPAFASTAAAEAAAEAGLGATDFEGRDPSGRSGYTVADVRALLEERRAREEASLPAGMVARPRGGFRCGNGCTRAYHKRQNLERYQAGCTRCRQANLNREN